MRRRSPPEHRTVCTATGTAVAGQYENTRHGDRDGCRPVRPADGHRRRSVALLRRRPGHRHREGHERRRRGQRRPARSSRSETPSTWTYVVTNTGNGELTGVAVTDDHGVTITCPPEIEPLDRSARSVTCTATGTAVPGQYENLATVTATARTTSVQDSDGSHYFGTRPDDRHREVRERPGRRHPDRTLDRGRPAGRLDLRDREHRQRPAHAGRERRPVPWSAAGLSAADPPPGTVVFCFGPSAPRPSPASTRTPPRSSARRPSWASRSATPTMRNYFGVLAPSISRSSPTARTPTSRPDRSSCPARRSRGHTRSRTRATPS